jgi:DNA (cytosine-5)-methyltransferase 1
VKENRKIMAADLFCGAGGTSQGLMMAANEIGADLELVAINHWDVAIDTHSINHPYAKHLCTGIDSVDPRKLVPGGRLNVLCASPECTHHSVARGGKPMSDQSRASAWHILHFAEALYIDSLLIENVPEFQSWGPLGANGRPLKSKRGQLFQQFISSLRALGYAVEWRVLNCADYGDPTTRRRLFIIGRRGNKKITWPEATHVSVAAVAQGNFFHGQKLNWRTAREIIDWKLPSKSIFERKRPLADKTLLRIQAGLKKFCGIDVDLCRCFAEDLRPFIVVFRNNQDAQSVDEPIPTLTTSGANIGLVTPFLLPHPRENDQPHSVDRPVRTVTSSSSDLSLCEPFVIPQGRWNEPRSVDKPLDTLTTTSRGVGLAEPFLTCFHGDHKARSDGSSRSISVEAPLPTQDTSNRLGLVEPFVMSTDQTGNPTSGTRSVDSPVGTVVTKANQAVVEAFMVTVNHGDGDTSRRARSVDDPMPTVTQKIGDGVCQPFLVAYYGTSGPSGSSEPVPTVTTKDRFGLVEAQITEYRLDIRFRMLQPRELARAQGFPDNYQFSGNREAVVKQIGNAVPPGTAAALLREVLL